jgi:uncharacterized protein YxeA
MVNSSKQSSRRFLMRNFTGYMTDECGDRYEVHFQANNSQEAHKYLQENYPESRVQYIEETVSETHDEQGGTTGKPHIVQVYTEEDLYSDDEHDEMDDLTPIDDKE